mgnify:FL=1
MANKILTPITLWSGFDDTLPVEATVLEERTEEKMLLRAVRFPGRAVGGERVNIFARSGMPAEGNSFPALLVLPDYESTADETLIRRFVRKGYVVLMPDYRGKYTDGDFNYTAYPQSISYANYKEAGEHLDFAEPSAKETCWYEWTAVARYCVKYLQSLPYVGKIGVIGTKAGGDVAFQLAATAEGLSCAIPVCAGGWRAYRGVHKFGENTELAMNDERYRFLAGVDAQAYAQYVKCPVLMLCASNDTRFDADRAFDTFARINPAMDKTFFFSARYCDCIGNTGMKDLDLFVDKYLKDREVFIPAPVEISIEEDEGELVARIRFDPNGEVTYCEVYLSEDTENSALRNWTRCELKREEGEDEQIFRLNAYKKSTRVFAFAKAKYSCGFAVSSKVAVKKPDKVYTNMTDKCRILYSSENKFDSFVLDDPSQKVMADCFLDAGDSPIRMIKGPHGINGIYSPFGLKLFRIGEERFRPAPNALLKLDVYSAAPGILRICVGASKNGVLEKYFCYLRLSGGECWADRVLYAKDFKTEENRPLSQFSDANYITFSSEGEFCINNLLWL